MLVQQIHDIAFHERLHRVQTNLHLVISELLAFGAACCDEAAQPLGMVPRLESITLVFSGELYAIHHLLYEPELAPEESNLNAILANLSSALNTLHEVLLKLPAGMERSRTLEDALRTISVLAAEICADCVPKTYAPSSRMLMDRIQQTARTIA
jgi:hypothetical protein